MIAIRSVLVVLAFGLGGLSVKAADSPISAFPDDTGIIVRLKNPQKTLQRAGELAVQVDRKEGIKVQLATPLLGVAISNPTLKGVDLNGDWWLAMFPVADGDPGLVFCIPATDADALQKSVMGDYKFQTFEKWVIYTEHAESADKIKRQLSKKGDSISSLQDKTSTAIWDEGDLSVFVNVPQLLKVYRGPFDEGVKKANDVLEQLPAMVPPQGGMDMKAIFDMYAGLFNQLAQAVRDAQGWTGGLSITAKGIAIDEYANFSEGSATRKILAGYKPSSLEDLGQLPAGRLGYGAAKLDMGALIKWGMKFSLQMFAEGDTEKEKLVKELMAEYQKVEFGGMAMA